MEKHFAAQGGWEQNNGRRKTRIFAECFHHHIKLPYSRFDLECALGDAIPVWRAAYPFARLYGCDISEVAITRCIADYGHLAEFFPVSLEALEGTWDVIYCSNMLEHFTDPVVVASQLLHHCSALYVMTPYKEDLVKDHDSGLEDNPHKSTFTRKSLDPLVVRGVAAAVCNKVFTCPDAWGLDVESTIRRVGGYFVRGRFLKAEPLVFPRQIVYIIQGKL